jgi:CDP-2,3-bis-(O-geranylgeranyl)-sn-glycerol synthase
MLNQAFLELFAQIINLVIFILPAYVANAAPVAFRTGSSPPMDMKLKWWDKRRILGKGKTILGFIVGVAAGTGAGAIIALFIPFYPVIETGIVVAFLLSLGAMSGDTLGSFVKRRLNFTKGKPFYIMDQLSFIIMALVFVYAYGAVPAFLDLPGIALLIIITIILHIGTNYIAFKLGLKSVPH